MPVDSIKTTSLYETLELKDFQYIHTFLESIYFLHAEKKS